jgi:hypothetical protein
MSNGPFEIRLLGSKVLGRDPTRDPRRGGHICLTTAATLTAATLTAARGPSCLVGRQRAKSSPGDRYEGAAAVDRPNLHPVNAAPWK